MKEILEFLEELRQNNDKEWFEANKPRYLAVKAQFEGFVAQLIDGIGGFDPTVRGLAVKDCTYRIYRDTRFSSDKTPYKTHMGAYVCMKGKKSGYAGYYFHLEPRDGNHLGGSLLSAGLYMPESPVLKSVREEILDNGAEFEADIRKAKGFRMGEDEKLKRVPNGFPADSPWAEYFKLKHVYIEKPVDDAFMLQKDLLEVVLKNYRTTKDFLDRINRAVAYAYEEAM